MGGQPDTALYTLLLRALLQQNKWDEGYSLIKKMALGRQPARPNFHTLNYLLQAQVMKKRWVEALDTLGLILRAVSYSASPTSATAISAAATTSGVSPRPTLSFVTNEIDLSGGLQDFAAASAAAAATGSAADVIGEKDDWQSDLPKAGWMLSPQNINMASTESTGSSVNRAASPGTVLAETENSLSFAMGLYSTRTQRIYREDMLHQQAWGNAGRLANSLPGSDGTTRVDTDQIERQKFSPSRY